ncbi:MAG: acyl carrier protein [Lentisphaeria bacterium]|nr:acyl carrier protein [Lentisphaeria bacterium]
MSDCSTMMTTEEIQGKVFDVFEDAFEIDRDLLTRDARIFTDLGLDSLDIVDLVVALQQAFGVKLRDNEKIRSIRTVGDVCEFISQIARDGADGSAPAGE